MTEGAGPSETGQGEVGELPGERRGLRRGLVTFCIGGGQGFSAIFEREE